MPISPLNVLSRFLLRDAIEYSREDLLTSVLPVYRRLLKEDLRILVFR
jgi:hypothetical protein